MDRRGPRRTAAEGVDDGRTPLAVLAGLRDAVALVDVDDGRRARVVYANPAFLELTGHAADTVVGYSPRLLQAAETDHDELERLCALVRTGETARGVVLARCADGSRRWVELDLVPLEGGGAARRVMGVLRDVTERVRSERLLALTGWQGHDLVVVTDADGALRRCEPPQRRVLGHDPGELVDRSVRSLVHADDAHRLREALADPPGAGAVMLRLRHADGSWRWLELHVADHRADARVGGLVLAGRDVSVREHMRAELARTVEQLRMAVGVAGLGTWQLDLDQDMLTQDAFSSDAFASDPDGPPMSLERGLAHVHPDDRDALRAAIRQALADRQGLEQTFRVARGGGSWRWLLLRGEVACAADGAPTHINGITLDVTDRSDAPAPGGRGSGGDHAERDRLAAAELTARFAAESAQAELAHAAAHDALTGLINRAELERRLSGLLEGSPSVVVLFIDVDDFRALNNSLGHAIGDAVLCHVAGRLTHRCRPSAIVSRFGGDKFVVALEGADLEEGLTVADRLSRALHEPYAVQGRDVTLTAGVGVAVAEDGDTVDALMRNADTAAASAKRGGRGRVAVYEDRLHQQALQRLDTESDLRATRNGEQLELRYQPIFALTDDRRVGVEALLRWHHPSRGLLQPGAFIDIAEDTGLIVPMGAWVIDRACRAVTDHRALGPMGTVWVNAAAPQFVRGDFATLVAEAQRRHGVRAGELGVELTERTLLTGREAVAAQLEQLHRLGVQIAIDDFGTGYSSMSLLQQYPIDVLKIDRAFIARLDTPDGAAIVRAVIQLAHALGAAASAEGIETQLQLDTVRATGCDSAAGYLLARPGPESAAMPRHIAG